MPTIGIFVQLAQPLTSASQRAVRARPETARETRPVARIVKARAMQLDQLAATTFVAFTPFVSTLATHRKHHPCPKPS